MPGKQTVIQIGDLRRAAEAGDLEAVKEAAENEVDMRMFGNTALHNAALNGHIEVCEYLLDRFYVSLLGEYGIHYRRLMDEAPEAVKAWCADYLDSYIRMDKEWERIVEDGDFEPDYFLMDPDDAGDEQHPLLTAACAGQLPAVIDLLIEQGRAGELSLKHLTCRDYDSTLIGYLHIFGGIEALFRRQIWAGRTDELLKFWDRIPETVRPGPDTLQFVFEDLRHQDWLKMVRKKDWPRLKRSRGRRRGSKT